MAKAKDDDESLKRLGGGRWQTRDERFTIEPQSGTWVVVDGEQTDDLGLPLIRGPFGSLGAAKEAIATRACPGSRSSRCRPVQAPLPRPSVEDRVAAERKTRRELDQAPQGRRRRQGPKPSKPEPGPSRAGSPTCRRPPVGAPVTRSSDSPRPARPDPEGHDPPRRRRVTCRRSRPSPDPPARRPRPDATPSAVVDRPGRRSRRRPRRRWRIVDGEGRPILIAGVRQAAADAADRAAHEAARPALVSRQASTAFRLPLTGTGPSGSPDRSSPSASQVARADDDLAGFAGRP